METIIKLNSSELSTAIIEKLLNFIKSSDKSEITISLKTPSETSKAISGEAYLKDLEESIHQLEKGENLIQFSYDEFVTFSNSLSKP